MPTRADASASLPPDNKSGVTADVQSTGASIGDAPGIVVPELSELKLRSPLVTKLMQNGDFCRVAAWMQARSDHGGTVPPLSPYHPNGCHLLFPTLMARPFHDDRSMDPPRLAEAVLLLERCAPMIRSELGALRHAKGFQPFRGRSMNRPAASDGLGHLTHDAGDWSVFYLMAGELLMGSDELLMGPDELLMGPDELLMGSDARPLLLPVLIALDCL
jgi:hypothetical protein